jgi:hypothetical protein
MAEFSVNVVTTAGLALIARAAAASQLIYTRVLSDADAMTAAAAALATPADFSGPEGTILAASATDVSCRVVGRIGNQSTAATVKTFAVCAKIDGDASDVVVAVLSDAAEIPIPDTSSPITGVEIGFLINISSADTVTVQVTGAGSVTFGDIARFVSCHKAGDPAAGEQQTILGAKRFENGADFGAGVGIEGELVVEGAVEMNNELLVDDQAQFNNNVHVYGELGILGNPSIDNGDLAVITQTVTPDTGSGSTLTMLLDWPDIVEDNIVFSVGAKMVCQGLEASGDAVITGTCSISGKLTVETVSEFRDDVAFNCNIYCGGFSVDADGNVDISSSVYFGAYGSVEIPGLAPAIVSSALRVPIGGIIGVCPSGVSGWAQDVPAGTEVTITAGLMPAAAWAVENARWGACPSGRTIPAGRYTCVTGWDYNSTGSTYGIVLLCRVQ